MPNILIVEDESAIADTVLYALRAEGFAARHVLTGREGLAAAEVECFDLAILDVGLPDIGGFALCRELRRARDLPVIFLTARDAEVDRLLGLEIGADDYVVKPFSPRASIAAPACTRRSTTRTRATSSRGSGPTHDGAFEHDVEGLRIRYRGHPLDLTRYEYGLLAALLARPGAVLSRAQLMDRVWGHALDSGDRTVDTHVKTLRAKLRDVDATADPIATHRGLGYSVDAG